MSEATSEGNVTMQGSLGKVYRKAMRKGGVKFARLHAYQREMSMQGNNER